MLTIKCSVPAHRRRSVKVFELLIEFYEGRDEKLLALLGGSGQVIKESQLIYRLRAPAPRMLPLVRYAAEQEYLFVLSSSETGVMTTVPANIKECGEIVSTILNTDLFNYLKLASPNISVIYQGLVRFPSRLVNITAQDTVASIKQVISCQNNSYVYVVVGIDSHDISRDLRTPLRASNFKGVWSFGLNACHELRERVAPTTPPWHVRLSELLGEEIAMTFEGF